MTNTKPPVKRSRKKSADAAPAAEASTATSTPESPRPAWVDGPTPDEPAASEPAKPWADPYKATFTCPAKQFELGEDRRFKQIVFKFKEKPDVAILNELKDAGFKYRANEKSWTVPASASTREMANRMAKAWASSEQAIARS